MRRPLIGITLCFLLGTWLGLRWHPPVAPLGLAFAIVAFTAWLRLRLQRRAGRSSRATLSRHLARPEVGTILVMGACLLAGAVSACRTSHRLPVRGGPVEMEIVGTVAGEPQPVAPVVKAVAIWALPVDLHRVRLAGQDWRPHRGRIQVRWHTAPRPQTGVPAGHAATLPAYGERWQIEGRLWKRRAAGRGADTYSFTTAARLSQRLSPGALHGPARLLFRARRGAAQLLSTGIEDHPAAAGILHALLLGYRRELPAQTHTLFATTGTLHIFALSGLHVGLWCGILIFLLSALRIPRTRWVFVLAPLLVAYTFATGAKASAVRACLMALIFFIAPAVGRRADSLSALALAALLIVAWAPRQLLHLGFILSFTVVLGLILLFPLIDRCIAALIGRLGGPQPLTPSPAPPLFWERDPAQLGTEPRPRLWLRTLVRYVAGLAALSTAAWLASAPLTAHYFGRFAPIALLGNIVVIPLAFLIVLCGCLSLVLGSCAVLFADIFNHANLVLVELLVAAMRGLGAVAGGSVTIDAVPVTAVAAWYAALAGVIYLGIAPASTRKESTSPTGNGIIE